MLMDFFFLEISCVSLYKNWQKEKKKFLSLLGTMQFFCLLSIALCMYIYFLFPNHHVTKMFHVVHVQEFDSILI